MLSSLKKRVWRIVEWFDQRKWAVILGALLVSSPATITGTAQYVPQIDAFLKAHPRGVFWGGILWPMCAMCLAALAHICRPPRQGSLRDVLQLLECLKRIVGDKVNRLESCLAGREDKTTEQIFQDITRPEEQLLSIVTGVYSFFEGTATEDQHGKKPMFRVALAVMGEKHIEAFVTHYPPHEKPRSSLADLQTDRSGFSRAKRVLSVVYSLLMSASTDSGAAFGFFGGD